MHNDEVNAKNIAHTSTRTSSDFFVGLGCFILCFTSCAGSDHVRKYAENILFYVICNL